jgi:integrase
MNLPAKDPARRCMPIDEWPALDRRAWSRGIAERDIFESTGPAFRWKPHTCDTVAKHYGRWLTFLSVSGMLETDQEPYQRIDRETLARYLAHLRECCATSTIHARVNGLLRAVSVMSPSADMRWLKAISDQLRRQVLSAYRGAVSLPNIADLYRFGLGLMNDADQRRKRGHLKDGVQYRDGLMIATLAARPVRLRNFAAIRIGSNLQRQGQTCWLHFATSKRRDALPYHVPLPEELTVYLNHYLDVYRERLLRDTAHSLLWISRHGLPMQPHTIRLAIRGWTKQSFGTAITPHEFRHCAATSIATQDPDHVQIAAVLLGHRSLDSSTRFYNHASVLEAARRYHQHIEELRRRSPER